MCIVNTTIYFIVIVYIHHSHKYEWGFNQMTNIFSLEISKVMGAHQVPNHNLTFFADRTVTWGAPIKWNPQEISSNMIFPSLRRGRFLNFYHENHGRGTSNPWIKNIKKKKKHHGLLEVDGSSSEILVFLKSSDSSLCSHPTGGNLGAGWSWHRL